MAYDESGGAEEEKFGEFLVDGGLNVHAVSGYASLACVAPFQGHKSCGVSIIEIL